MQLNFKQHSDTGPVLVILHGLFGSLVNWNWQARQFAEDFTVHTLDLRNHGGSPHTDSMDYPSMAADVLEFMDDHSIDRCHVLGHSMGGKVAMQMALGHPERIGRLVVVDIAPVEYAGEHDEIFEGLLALDPAGIRSRREADQQLASRVEDEQVRQFLLSNLYRTDEGSLAWRINLSGLHDCYPQLLAAPAGNEPFDGDTLFVKGDMSDYISETCREELLKKFPRARLKTVMQAGHWLHAEKPQTFNRLVRDFLCEE